ncbi:MAG: succinate dehydrogenase assembly factor 2 [Gemmobacter sp.]
MSEIQEARLRRMRMRAWRRGTREMDLILGPFADARLGAMAGPALDGFDALLAENDQELLDWVLGRVPVPEGFAGLIAEIGDFARARLGPASDAGPGMS